MKRGFSTKYTFPEFTRPKFKVKQRHSLQRGTSAVLLNGWIAITGTYLTWPSRRFHRKSQRHDITSFITWPFCTSLLLHAGEQALLVYHQARGLHHFHFNQTTMVPGQFWKI
jgi:hypothetical protein